jgi:hypothetical protein
LKGPRDAIIETHEITVWYENRTGISDDMRSPSRSPKGNTGVKSEEDRNAIYAWKHDIVLTAEEFLGLGAFQVGTVIDGYRLGRSRVSDGIAGRVGGQETASMERGGVSDDCPTRKDWDDLNSRKAALDTHRKGGV